MKQLLILSALAMIFLSAECGNNRLEKAYEVGTPFTLRVQEILGCNCTAPDIKFEGIKEDSRCPEFTNCIRAGEAIVQLTILDGSPIPLELSMEEGKPAKASKEVGGYIYRLEEVSPYPEAGKKIAPADYIIRLVVERP